MTFKLMNDRDWCALPLEQRQWAVEQALEASPFGVGIDRLNAAAREIMTVTLGAPLEAVSTEMVDDTQPPTRNWRQERGLVG